MPPSRAFEPQLGAHHAALAEAVAQQLDRALYHRSQGRRGAADRPFGELDDVALRHTALVGRLHHPLHDVAAGLAEALGADPSRFCSGHGPGLNRPGSYRLMLQRELRDSLRLATAAYRALCVSRVGVVLHVPLGSDCWWVSAHGRWRGDLDPDRGDVPREYLPYPDLRVGDHALGLPPDGHRLSYDEAYALVVGATVRAHAERTGAEVAHWRSQGLLRDGVVWKHLTPSREEVVELLTPLGHRAGHVRPDEPLEIRRRPAHWLGNLGAPYVLDGEPTPVGMACAGPAGALRDYDQRGGHVGALQGHLACTRSCPAGVFYVLEARLQAVYRVERWDRTSGELEVRHVAGRRDLWPDDDPPSSTDDGDPDERLDPTLLAAVRDLVALGALFSFPSTGAPVDDWRVAKAHLASAPGPSTLSRGRSPSQLKCPSHENSGPHDSSATARSPGDEPQLAELTVLERQTPLQGAWDPPTEDQLDELPPQELP